MNKLAQTGLVQDQETQEHFLLEGHPRNKKAKKAKNQHGMNPIRDGTKRWTIVKNKWK